MTSVRSTKPKLGLPMLYFILTLFIPKFLLSISFLSVLRIFPLTFSSLLMQPIFCASSGMCACLCHGVEPLLTIVNHL